MADFKQTLMGIWNEGVKAVNDIANGVAGATRYKMDELDNVSRRREAITELGEKVYELYQAGVTMPDEVLPLLGEMRALDENLEKMRADHAEQKRASAEQRAQERADAKQRRAEAKAARKNDGNTAETEADIVVEPDVVDDTEAAPAEAKEFTVVLDLEDDEENKDGNA